MSSDEGRVEAIHITATAGRAMVGVQRVQAIAGSGLQGDRYSLGTGHWSAIRRRGDGLTLIEAEAIEALRIEHGITLAFGEARRNVTTRGIRLDDLIGRRFRLGSAVCHGIRRCEPCSYLEGLVGQEVLYPLVHRGGIRVEILEGGWIDVGDAVVTLPGPVTATP